MRMRTVSLCIHIVSIIMYNCTVQILVLFIVVAIYEERLSFNQLRAQGSIQFPAAGVVLPSFNRPALIPKVELSSAFIFAARGKDYSMGANGTEEDDEMTGVVNTVWNNIENYLPNTLIDKATEEESLR